MDTEQRSGMKELRYPFDEKQVRALKAGDAVSISGLVHTGRDKFHKFFADGGKIPVDFHDGALYHCGPVCVKREDGWTVVSAGPTCRRYSVRSVTSWRSPPAWR